MTQTAQYPRLYFPDLADKMAARVTVDSATGCWNWTKGLNPDGYGNGLYHEGKQVRAHRVAFLVAMGCLPPPENPVRHLCSNPQCCRPTHLAVGTFKENAQDTVAAGRHRQSSKTLRQRKADALEVRMAAAGETRSELAARLGISLSAVSRIRRRAGIRSARHRKLTESDVVVIRQSDATNKELAARYGVTAPNIHAIRQRRTWQHVV